MINIDVAAYSGDECVDGSVDLPTSETSPSSSSETGPPLKKPQVSRSDVWDFFEKLPDTDKKVRCILCHPQKDFAFHGGTTNLREHLSSKHPLEYKAETKKQTTLFDYTKHSRCSEARKRNITSLILDMVAIDLRPLRLVEGEGFNKLMEYLEPGYKVPSAMHMASLLHRKYKAGYERLKEILKVDPSAISLTTDLWTSIANDSFITVSAHFISPDWDMCSVVLCTSAFPERHTGAEISQKLIDIAEESEISQKVACIVHDQGSNMVLTMKLLSDEKGWNTLRCSAHCLQLSINAGLSSVSVIDCMIGAAKKLVGHFRHSVVASEALKQRQEQMGIPQKKLVQSCLTRWNSVYEMMLRLLEMRWPISAVIMDETVTKRVYWYLDLKSEQWTLMEELVEVLKPLKVATTFLQYEHNSSLSCILPIIHGLDLSLQPTSDYSTSVQQFKEKFDKKLGFDGS